MTKTCFLFIVAVVMLCSVSISTSAQSCAPPWNAATTYASPGNLVSENATNFKNNWWTLGDDPATHNGGPGSGQPWTSTGPCFKGPDFSISVTPASQSTTVGGKASYTITIAPLNGFNSAVSLSVAGVPSGATATFNPPTISSGSGSSALSVSTSNSTPAGSFSLQISATSGSLSHAATASLFVGSPGNGKATFASYHDVTANADFNTGLQRTAVTGTVQPVTSAMPNKTLIWAFATGTCDAENWAGISPAMEATNVQAFVNAGKNYIISTGGANGAFDCSSGQGLINFINRYNSPNLTGIDFDIELGQSQQLIDNLINATIAAQRQFPNLQFSFTIQSLGSLSANPITGGSVGTTVVKEIKRLGLGGNYVINLMTFDYGSTNVNNCVVVNNLCDMGQSAIAAAQALNQQSGIPFNHIGITMMIGRADTQDEVTSLHDIDTINAFVISNGLPVSRFWAFERDTPNGTGNNNSNGNGAPVLAYTHEFMNSLGVQ